MRTRLTHVGVIGLLFLWVFSALGTVTPSVVAQEDTERLIAEGRLVYEANCQACHQADGSGVSGVFPPLVDNPNLADVEYVRSVVVGGRVGPLEVNGVTYDGAMPAFSALSTDQVDAVVAFVQEGIGVEVPPPEAAPAPEGVPAATQLPIGTVVTSVAAFLIALAVAVVVVAPLVVARRVGSERFSSAQVWLKTVAIVAYFIVATVFIPSLVVESELLASPPDLYLDLFSAELWGLIRDSIATGVWLFALGLGIWALRRAQRDRVI